MLSKKGTGRLTLRGSGDLEGLVTSKVTSRAIAMHDLS